MIQRIVVSLVVLFQLFSSQAQHPTSYRPGDIKQRLNKLNVLGSVLYVAAHPDDENTRMIAYYANEELVRTAYLSATRGDGGQNLIGPEIREELGLIRTQELLAARRTDGGRQFFSRANDFGYSKHPDETFTIWDREQVLADFVWVMRKFRPDVVITRFSEIPGYTHGHHTASAILAKEAFALSGDPTAYPEQLEWVDAWQPRRLYWNTSWWFYRNTGQAMDTAAFVTINVGQYNPLLGESYPEIAAKSRSMHKSQGFGSAGSRGDLIEYLEPIQGVEKRTKPLDGLDISWSRVPDSEKVATLIQEAIEKYDPENPSRIIPSLIRARNAMQELKDPFWATIKTREMDEIIRMVSGLYLSIVAEESAYSEGDSIQLSFEAVNRSPESFTLESVSFDLWDTQVPFGNPLSANKVFRADMNFRISENTPYTHPYWLQQEGTLGMYSVSDATLIGQPENTPPITGQVRINYENEILAYSVPVVFKRTDPVDGEVTEPISIGPPATATILSDVLVFGSGVAKEVEVRVVAGKEAVRGDLKLSVPSGWEVQPDVHNFELPQKNEEQVFTFRITPPATSSAGYIRAGIQVGDKTYDRAKTRIDYDHIPKQVLFPPSEVKVVRVDLKKRGNRIGYIEGAGDALPQNLKQIGYEVDLLEKDDVNAANLSQYDAVVLGVRAFNTVQWLSFKNEELFKYVNQGGNVLVQYNTNRRLVTDKLAPYSLTLSRDRVTVEEAEVKILARDHPAITGPNQITSTDFEGWVQERGLYFPDEWAEEFVPLLSSHDPGESPKQGGLLVAKYGKGYYVYSGYSWFRELPAGVPGAYRLFVNLLSLGK